MALLPNFEQSKNVKHSFNVGCLFDIPTGYYVKGKYGESILNGGLAFLTAIVGIGNSYKSTILHYLGLSALNRIFYATEESSMSTYDTEININHNRLEKFVSRFEYLKNKGIIANGIWNITDKTVYYANEWYQKLREFFTDVKAKVSPKEYLETPFLERDGKTLSRILPPTFSEIDSLSQFETSDIADIQEKNQLGESGGNMIYMRSGLAKARFLMELPTICGKNNHYLLMTAHMGKDTNISTGPFSVPPPQKLSSLKHGDKIKGVTDNFFFLLINVWYAYSNSPLINQNTKGPEYPPTSDLNKQESVDLYSVKLRSLRSKTGLTNITFEVIVSQYEGVMPELTEYHYIKTMDRYGLGGSLQAVKLDLYPDLSFSRTTVREAINKDPLFCRALNITAEMCQIHYLWPTLEDDLMCTPKELYDDLIKLGYDWNALLQTRGWWTFNNDKHPIPFLSTMDLLRMRKGLYTPYWLNKKDKK